MKDIDRIKQILERDSRIETLILVGSFARGDYKPTSDIDLILVTGSRSQLILDQTFFSLFGTVEETIKEDYGNCTSVRVFYTAGPEVEFGFVDPSWLDVPLDLGTRAVLDDGYVVLFDRTGRFALAEAELEKQPE